MAQTSLPLYQIVASLNITDLLISLSFWSAYEISHLISWSSLCQAAIQGL